jgi:hypothetical protein
MLVEYVWPFRELHDSTERKTFFWLECSYDEAIDVLRQVSLSAGDFRSYIEHLFEFKLNGLGSRQVDQGLEVYTRIGFLISEDGKVVEWALPGFPISNMWNAYNPFRNSRRMEVDTFSDFFKMSRRFADDTPFYSNLDDEREIPHRTNLAALSGKGESALLNMVNASELGCTAVEIFYGRYCAGATINDLQFFNTDSDSQWELGHQYIDLLSKAANQESLDVLSSVIDFRGMSLQEIYARKKRAIRNLVDLERIINGQDGVKSRSPQSALKLLCDDEICELALLMERYTRAQSIKWIFGEYMNRTSNLLSLNSEMPEFPQDFQRVCPPFRPVADSGRDDFWAIHPSDGDLQTPDT